MKAGSLRTLHPFHWGRRYVSTVTSSPTTHRTYEDIPHQRFTAPFYFETGYALFAKRPSRPFPPPFSSPPSASFSEPLSTHNHNIDRRSSVDGRAIRGITNGDDAVLAGSHFIGANDGVGAWATRENGHAGLWSRLILHFWALEVEKDQKSSLSRGTDLDPDPIRYLQTAYEHTKAATSSPNEWKGTTTACAALLHHAIHSDTAKPVLYVTNLGDSQCLVIRPRDESLIYKTTEQWHWFDCPRQLGTNSPDTPIANATMEKVAIEENDIVLAMSDGVVDNLWEHEVVDNVIESLRKWDSAEAGNATDSDGRYGKRKMLFVAEELMKAARNIAQDPYAESPFMERAVEEGLAMEGGKLDDISVVAAICSKCKG